ncbi:hypothetical protein [Flavobacterium wongokense]|uniref:hypothetical protein n=1 Tax=Flavobacterium wongokense TaxID=2910674 RepID=UPI001F2FE96A|nr:hypothetical protein [Flavobacterium sp. WG47]MCF6133546.1 hypothetical protein [Flavobacterium sp. WG47]
MRTIKFNPEEIKMLKEIIVLGESQYDNYFGETSKVILNKIRIEIFHFDKKETQLLKSYTSNWINNHDEILEELRVKFLVNKNPDYNAISETEKEYMRKISMVFAIKSKILKESFITFKEVLEKA